MASNKTPLKNDFYFFDQNRDINIISRSVNWEQSSLGSPNQWPISLRNTLSLISSSGLPMLLWWGGELYQFCNTACVTTLGNTYKIAEQRHIDDGSYKLHVSRSVIEQVVQSGETAFFEDQLIVLQSKELYFTINFSPVIGDSGYIEGVLAVYCETTEKVNLIKKLSASEKGFQTLIQEAEIGIIVLEGSENLAVIVNDAYLRLVNRKYEEIVRKPLFEVIPESEPYFKSIIDNVRNSGEPYYLYEHPYFAIDLEGRKVEGYLNLVYQPHGISDSIAGVMVLCHDVTQEVQSKKRINESEQRVRSLVDSAPFPIGVYEGAEMRISLANQAIIDVWAKGRDVVGKTYFDVLPELKDQEIYPKLLDVFREGKPFHARNQRVDLEVNGKIEKFYFNYSFTPLFDNTGKVYGVMNTAADVTDLNLAKIMVEQSQKDFRSLILQAPLSMCLMVGPLHTVEVANSYIINLWGKEENEVMNKPIFEALPDARKQGLEELLDHVYTTGETYTASEMPVHLIRYGEPDVVYQNFIYEPYKDLNGNVLGVIAISNDVTQQVLARQQIEEIVTMRTAELETANKSLIRSNEELAQFAYIASHDLQEPLRKITTFSQLLDTSLGEKKSDHDQKYIDKIMLLSNRMRNLINDVLNYSKLAKSEDILTDVDLNEVVEHLILDYDLLIEQKNAHVHVSDLPVVKANDVQMSQLFRNLIGNALKFSHTERDPVISITAASATLEDIQNATGGNVPEDFCKIEITDNGIGFAPEYFQQIFNIFQRLHSKTVYEGTGIGLAMCKKITQNHGGDIFAQAKEGEGAIFSIVLPC